MVSEKIDSIHRTAGSIHEVKRAAPSKTVLKASAARFKKKMTAELGKEIEAIKVQAQHMARIGAPLHALVEQDRRAVASRAALDRFVEKDQKLRLERLAELSRRDSFQTFSFTANSGFQVIAPPYDMEWTTNEGQGLGLADKSRGSLRALSANGIAGAGVSVFLSSPVRSLVRVTPFAPLTYFWEGYCYNVSTWCSGTVGVVVYVDRNPQPLHDVRARLWDAHLSFPGYHDSGSGSTTVGRELPRDVVITMEVGSTYELWVWCNVLVHSQWFGSETEIKVGSSWAEINCNVPFMVMDASPPPVVR